MVDYNIKHQFRFSEKSMFSRLAVVESVMAKGIREHCTGSEVHSWGLYEIATPTLQKTYPLVKVISIDAIMKLKSARETASVFNKQPFKGRLQLIRMNCAEQCSDPYVNTAHS